MQVSVLSAACARDFQRILDNASKMAIAFYVFSLISKNLSKIFILNLFVCGIYKIVIFYILICSASIYLN